MKNNRDFVLKEMVRLKKEAERYPILTDKFKMPHIRHWANLPGDVKVCFTKKFDSGIFYYHLSVSQANGNKVDDTVIMELFKMLDAPRAIEEIPSFINHAVRHFMWT